MLEHVQHNAPRGQKTASGREAESFDVFDEELGGGRPPPLPDVAGAQARVRRAVEKTEDFMPMVQIFDAPVPQVVDQLMDVLTRFDIPVPEQVIEVPKISCPSRPLRAVLWKPQTAEQLVDVPTVVSFSSLQQQTAEQLVVIPVSRRGGGGRLPGFHPGQVTVQRFAEQNIDTSVLGRGVSGGLQGPHPGPASEQRSVEQNADIPVPRRRDIGGLHGSSPRFLTEFCGAERGHPSSSSCKSWKSSIFSPRSGLLSVSRCRTSSSSFPS